MCGWIISDSLLLLMMSILRIHNFLTNGFRLIQVNHAGGLDLQIETQHSRHYHRYQ